MTIAMFDRAEIDYQTCPNVENGSRSTLTDQHQSKPRAAEARQLVLLITIVIPLFIAVGQWGTEGNPDVVAANVASWQLAENGTLDLSEFDVVTNNLDTLGRWYVELPDGRVVSNRSPGLIGVAYPAYLLAGTEDFSLAPGTFVALTATTLAIVVSWRVLIPLVGLRPATASALVLAVGTPTWWISAAQLWPHGPGQLFAALAVAALAASRHSFVGLAGAGSLVLRPVTAVFSAGIGVLESLRLRSPKPAVLVAWTSALGLSALLIYNRWVFGSWSLRGGYSDRFTSGAIEGFDIASYFVNILDMFVLLPHGFLTTTPILGVALIGAILNRQRIPGWVWSAGAAALAYLLIHAALNRASGGLGVLYRYPLEPIVLAAPLFAIGAIALWDRGGLARRAVVGSALISVFVQVLYVLVLSCNFDPEAPMCLL